MELIKKQQKSIIINKMNVNKMQTTIKMRIKN